jgi:hypothetical protein
MPKTDIDYSNTIIYKIACKDTEIKDVYVGHTTNFVQRKHSHKQGCNNPKSSNYDCKLYNTIREKGGWTNWRMEILNFFNCFDHYEARQKEQEYFISLNANLNSIQPMPKPKEKPEDAQDEHDVQSPQIKQKHLCTMCNIICDTLKQFEIHNKTNKHKKRMANHLAEQIETVGFQQSSGKFNCEICQYSTNRNSQYKRHIMSSKHKNKTTLKHTSLDKYACTCEKIFGSRTTLWRHKIKCDEEPINNKITEPLTNNNTDLITYLMNENKELKNMIMEICKNTNVK